MNPILSLNEMANGIAKFAIIAIDQTKYWSEDIQAKAKRIDTVYLVNLQEPTNLCELAVSYPAKFIKNYVHNAEAFSEDELAEIERNNGGEDDSYLQGTNQYAAVKYYNGEEDTEETVYENEQANPSYC